MKKFIFCMLLMMLSLKVQAQLTNGNFTTEVDYRLQNISKAPITSNILIDRVFPVAGVQAFNQGTRKDTSNVTHFKQAWSELYRASYSKNFSSIETFKNQLKAKNYAPNVIPIGIINTEFHQGNFGTTAQNANVGFNPSTGLFTNVSRRNPFIKKQTTIIAPLVAKASGRSITFTTDNLFKLYKHGKRIKTLCLFTNNTSFTLINNYNLANANFSTTYKSTSTQTLRFVITYSDNTTKTTYGTVKIIKTSTYVRRSSSSSSNLKTIDADDDLLFQGYDENQAYRGQNKYRIYYDTQNNNQVVNKPLYIIDGYDPNDVRKIQASDYDNYNPNDDKSIIQLMQYEDNNEEKVSLVDLLNKKGFDVIIVNHPVYDRGSKTIDGGSDYIERNAYTFISLMRYIKSIQQGNEKAVVIGPSMGGLISRYALAYMEKKLAKTGDSKKWDHNTRLWVSFDSPHQGANIPIGVQKGIQYFAEELEVEGAKTFINEELSKPAPKQMLVNHYTNNTSFPVGAPNFRDRFQKALDKLGMPNNLRKVALINGSVFGSLNGVSSAKYLEIDDNLTHLSPVLSLNVIANIFADRFKANFYNTTNQKLGNGETFTFDGGIRGKFLWWSWWTTRTSYKSHPKSKGGYDVSPGGYFNAQQLLVNETTNPSTEFTWDLLSWTFHNLNSNLIDPASSFIPTKSALAYTGSNVLDQNISDQNRVCTRETPFDSYFAPQNNEEHIHLTNKNVTWLTEEIMGNPQAPIPHTATKPSIFASSNTICVNKDETYTYTLSDCTALEAINWSVTSNLQILSTTPYTATVKSINTNLNSATRITATLEDGQKISKSLILKNKPTITFEDTSLRDAILAGVSPSNYPNVRIANGERVNLETTLANNVSWKYTRERIYIPEDEPGIHTYYDPESLLGNFVPYLSCFPFEDINGLTNSPNSVVGQVPLIDYYFTEDNYRNLPEQNHDPLPNGLQYPIGVEMGFQEIAPNKSPKIYFEDNGLLQVEVTASNECGCVTDTNVYKTTTSITGSTGAITTPKPFLDFTVSPNPSNNLGNVSIHIYRNYPETYPFDVEIVFCTIEVINLSNGTLVSSQDMIFNQNQATTFIQSEFSQGAIPGTYVVKITSNHGVVTQILVIN